MQLGSEATTAAAGHGREVPTVSIGFPQNELESFNAFNAVAPILVFVAQATRRPEAAPLDLQGFGSLVRQRSRDRPAPCR
ncbi:hypothetical protein CCGE525_14940 [Rhizobium jaguaris]|uniref:Uncharacterized protein n=1 Tax=Rhizobium jaguaris TaxID=1312183 RepID=A0A387FKM7_9HYPH|nr:hypothetical protein CCGE525_14940 [Rhizobium jaguaris]